MFSSNATGVELLIFNEHDDVAPVQVIEFDPAARRVLQLWGVHVRGLRAGAQYAFRVHGPWDPGAGHRFDAEKVVLDPYARAIYKTLWDRDTACRAGDTVATSMRGVVVDAADYDWEGDVPLGHRMRDTIVYEMHVRSFTRSLSSGVEHPGTYAGIIEKIPYLQELGVTAVELLPVMAFDESEGYISNPTEGPPLRNFWGYSTVGFFAPHPEYCIDPGDSNHIREFRDMVKALHKAGIEVILDVVFNHTSEGNHLGPTISYKGLDNSVYYYLSPQDRTYYQDFSGCGNTLNCNHPVVEKLIVDSLEYWVKEMHVDGFRFDEASILSRGPDGGPMTYPPVLWHIELSETLSETKIIAEAWDAAGLYQVGYFPGYRWAEWNGHFRDDVRRFIRGDPGMVSAVASRMAGSADIYEASGRLPMNSLNFVTCHDGFTLNDVVSYNAKHNEANGESNRDGMDENFSWNCGVEGTTDDWDVERLRDRQVKNFAAVLLLSQGVPMIRAGDEVRRTQRGNNNAYCQDNEISWFDWSLLERHADLLRFFKQMIAFRKRHRVLHQVRFFTGTVTNERGLPDIAWHGCTWLAPGFDDPSSQVLAFTLGGAGDEADVHVILNMSPADLDFELREPVGRKWYPVANTSLPSPHDFVEPGKEIPVDTRVVRAASHSVVILISAAAEPNPRADA